MFYADSLTCHRGNRTLFSGLGFTLLPGGTLVLGGVNGSGKTSLLHLLAGISKPAAGSINIGDGLNIHEHYSDYCQLMLYIGHKNALKPQLTAKENLTFWAKLRGSEELVPAALHYFGLEEYADTPYHKLSAGWKQRVSLARLIACPAELWLLDEPTAHLDEAGKELLFYAINSRCSQGGIVIAASHDPIPLKCASWLYVDDFIPPATDMEEEAA